MSRYFRKSTAINGSQQYKKVFDKRGVSNITQFRTPQFRPVTDAELESIEVYKHIFKIGDAYWNLSERAYGDPQFWWVIASFNKKPTLSDLKDGDIVRIPVDLSQALELLE